MAKEQPKHWPPGAPPVRKQEGAAEEVYVFPPKGAPPETNKEVKTK